MSYLEALSRALGRRGVRGRLRERILLELADHLHCEPKARLGDPEELSAHFADELGGGRAQRAALAAFGSLGVVGLAVAVTQASLTSYPDVFSGSSIVLAALAGFCVLGALAHARAGRITVSGEGGTCDPVDELGPLARPLAPLRGRPYVLAILVGGAVVLAMLAGAWYAEGSPEEGLLRAAFEAVAFATAFLSLGRVLGLHGEGRHA